MSYSKWYHIYSETTDKELYIEGYYKAKRYFNKLVNEGVKRVFLAKCDNQYEDSPETIREKK